MTARADNHHLVPIFEPSRLIEHARSGYFLPSANCSSRYGMGGFVGQIKTIRWPARLALSLDCYTRPPDRVLWARSDTIAR